MSSQILSNTHSNSQRASFTRRATQTETHMDYLQVLHMNKGEGETSYAKNSIVQRKIINSANPVIEEAVVGILCNNFPESMGIADLGCSSGPNTLMLIAEVIDIVHATCGKMGKPLPELRVSLNDLPGNDFNDIFISLPAFYRKLEEEKGKGLFDKCCFISGVAGSFYGRLFPRKSMHFVHSSSSLHWLSQVPPSLDKDARIPLNKGKIFISKTSPLSVRNAYLSQFQKDFFLFLKSRSEEIVPGGRMVLSFLGRSSADPSSEESCYQWELLAQALKSMDSQVHFLEEKIDSFNAPYYAPSLEEVKTAFDEEGSFFINCLKAFEIDWDMGCQADFSPENKDSKLGRLSRGQQVARTVRAVVESMFECHFGTGINVDALFKGYAELVDEYFSRARPKYINLMISVTRNL